MIDSDRIVKAPDFSGALKQQESLFPSNSEKEAESAEYPRDELLYTPATLVPPPRRRQTHYHLLGRHVRLGADTLGELQKFWIGHSISSLKGLRRL